MPAWIHDRAEHLLAKNPKMTKGQAFAISTQQGHKLGKNPKGYGTKEGKKDARTKYDKPRKEYVKTPNPKGLESPKLAAMRVELEKWAKDLADSPYLLSQIGRPKVRLRRAEAPEPKHRVKLAVPQVGVFGQPTTIGGGAGGAMNPAKQLANSQKVGAPKMPQPKMKTLSMKTASGDMIEYFNKHPKKLEEWKARHKGKKTKESCGSTKLSAMADELAKLNGVPTTPQGKLYSTQRVGAPKVTAPPGPSISELSKPVGYGTKAPGAVKGSI